MATIRVATFNVENLFDRSKLLNQNDHSIGDQKIKALGQFLTELRRTTYNKPRILQLWAQLKAFVTVRANRGKLFNKAKTAVRANGRKDWEGSIELKREKIDDEAQRNTAKVIRSVNADVMCLVEVESRPVLKRFNSDRLYGPYKYDYPFVIDGNDQRGIDVGLLSNLELGGAWTHMWDKIGTKRVFSRDCPEFQLRLPGGEDLWVLVNHFKSKGYGSTSTSNAKRKRQATRVAQILTQDYDLTRDYVVVAGDLNDTPNSAPLAPLLGLSNLYDVLALQFPNAADRWTYHYNSNQQIDYLLVSRALKQKFVSAGVERRGIYGLAGYTGGAEQSWSAVDSYRSSASDHAAIYADFNL